MPGVIPGGEGNPCHSRSEAADADGNVEWDGQHCRFCRFLATCRGCPPFGLGIQAGLPRLPGLIRGKIAAKTARCGNKVARWAAKTARFVAKAATLAAKTARMDGVAAASAH